MRALTTFCLLLLFLTGCDQRRDIRDYYFPVRELIGEDALVYAYNNTGTIPGPETEYIYHLGIDLDTALYLSVTKYGPDLAPAQQARERIQNDAVYLDHLTILPRDTDGVAHPSPTELLYDRIYPFYPTDNKPTGYRIRYHPATRPNETDYITLDRIFRADTTINVLGQTYDAVVFDLRGEVSVRDRTDGDISPPFTGYEIYARGLGRVEYYRDIGGGLSFGGRLAERITMAEFTERVRQQQ